MHICIYIYTCTCICTHDADSNWKASGARLWVSTHTLALARHGFVSAELATLASSD